MTKTVITVAGAGIIGLWQALTLARAGHRVRLLDANPTPFADSASRWAAAMIAPDCEAETAPRIVRDWGRQALDIWRANYPAFEMRGTLVVAAARDVSELKRLARATEGHRIVDAGEIALLEPELADRFSTGLYFAEEGHMDAAAALHWLLDCVREAGVDVALGTAWNGGSNGIVIDCRGFAARQDLKSLRGVRGERVLVAAPDVALSRPVRLLHPRTPIYIAPQVGARYVIGASVIEREDGGPMTVRSALELLGSAYALHPGFAEASILDLGAGVRPAFPDNAPRVIVDDGGRIIRVNGVYRHGFLLAPVLAEAIAAFLATGKLHANFIGEA